MKRELNIYNILIALLIISIWAFNEVKIITYPIKIVCILAFGLYTMSRGKYSSKYQTWCIVMTVLSCFCALIASDMNAANYALINMIQVFLIAFCLYGYVDDKEKIDIILKCFVLAGVVLTIRLAIATPSSVWLSWQRLGEAIGSNSNDIGNKAAFSSITALYYIKQRVKGKSLYIVAFVLFNLIVLFSGSRKALLAVLLGAFLFYTIGLEKKQNIFFSIIGISIVVVVLYKIMMTNDALYMTIGRRIESMIDVFFHGASEAGSIDLREKYIKMAWDLILKHPLFGIGLNNFASASGGGVYSHCDYTEVACSYGLIGALIYYSAILLTTVKTIQNKKKDVLDYYLLILEIVLLFTFISMVMYTSVYIQLFVIVAYSNNQIRIKSENEIYKKKDYLDD